MHFLARKIINSPCKLKLAGRTGSALFLAGRLLLAAAPALFIACSSEPQIEHSAFALATYYIPDSARESEAGYGQLFGKKNFILEVLEQVDSIYKLSAPYAFSVPAPLLPGDAAEILQKYLLPDKNKTYYSYVLEHVDRIIFCPKIVLKNQGKALGLTMENSLLDKYLYPAERLIYINSLHTEFRRIASEEILSKTITIVHETAHREFFKLVLELKLDYTYYQEKYTERYARLVEEAFCQHLLTDPAFAYAQTLLSRKLKRCTSLVEDYNRQFGLAPTDRTPLPLKNGAGL
ncbi:MAG: hypothetical protein LBQ83_03965 [Candidatus Margulisbacteria bacterium]|jgi:hypothetical protein|nr:hypothetical protein [Candidatus Margulisiibacteriota bacterium]